MKKHNKTRKPRAEEREQGVWQREKRQAHTQRRNKLQRFETHSVERDESDAGGCLGRWVGLPTVNLSLTSPEFLRAQPPPNTAVLYCCLGDRTPFEKRSVK